MNNNASRNVVPSSNYAAAEDAAMSRVVVVADDDVEFAGVLKQHLERDHFSITLVNDAQEAVRQALSGKQDVVVLETAMPGMDGVDALREIKNASQVPVLMMT